MLRPADFFRLPAAKYCFLQICDVQSSLHLVDQYVLKLVSPFDKRVTEGETLKGAGGAEGCALAKTISRISTFCDLGGIFT
jgi:hypothetical protein